MSLRHLALLAVIRPMRAGFRRAREALTICRQPREAVCDEIRAELAVLTGRALRRRLLRHHVEHCEDCRAFATEVHRQKAGLAILLSVVPSLALKHNVLTGVWGAAGDDVAASSAPAEMEGGRAAVTGGAGAIAGGEAAAGPQNVGARILLALVVAGGARWHVLRRRGADRRRPVPPRLPQDDPGTQRAPSDDARRDGVRERPARRHRRR